LILKRIRSDIANPETIPLITISHMCGNNIKTMKGVAITEIITIRIKIKPLIEMVVSSSSIDEYLNMRYFKLKKMKEDKAVDTM